MERRRRRSTSRVTSRSVSTPATGALAVALWIGLYALASGIVLIALGFRLRSWARLHPPGAERLA